MDLLSEVLTSVQVLNFSLSRALGQEHQREILRSNITKWNQVNATFQQQNSRPKQRPQSNAQRQTNSQEFQPCWRCVAPIVQGLTNVCQAKQAQSNICKKIGHYAKLCRSKMLERPKQRQLERHQQQGYGQFPGSSQKRRVRHVTEQSQSNNQATHEDEVESIDPESLLCLKKLTDDWAKINLCHLSTFRPVGNVQLNKSNNDEI